MTCGYVKTDAVDHGTDSLRALVSETIGAASRLDCFARPSLLKRVYRSLYLLTGKRRMPERQRFVIDDSNSKIEECRILLIDRTEQLFDELGPQPPRCESFAREPADGRRVGWVTSP